MKICQKQMIKSVHVENLPVIGCCKVYDCNITGLSYPCLLEISTQVVLDDTCFECERGVAEGEKV